ncbi:tRNA (guanosine(46)-N7)-methyltransferase TrmB [Nesterenkonia populi]|uniref:tRNA (guanosine(46)-N7)-methyltransferase TrmB n=1 Tax=Nesterenkonia populi TaxID=1591087 RepID=UPI0011BDD81D|nr:tRNA (guanosine(46)-N7)-methyltransferase TrmB [Nesterenkonia populi]
MPQTSENIPGSADAPTHRRRTLSFVRRSNNLKPSYQRAWDAALGKELLDVPSGERDTSVAEGFSIDWEQEFGRRHDVAGSGLIVEIGSGSGEAVAAAAAASPHQDFIAVEVYRPGAAQLAARLRREGLPNVRVACLDAVELLDKLIPEGHLDELWIFFPDPWHKKKHNKRRLIQPPFTAKAARALRPGGRWRLATDWPHYAVQMRRVISESAEFSNANQGWAPRFPGRVLTDFEAKAGEAGRKSFDLTFIRNSV